MENPYDAKLWTRCDVFGNHDKDGIHRIKGSRITTEFGLTCLCLGYIEGKAEQAELLDSLLLVASTVVRYYRRRQDHVVPSHQIDSLEQLIAKAKGKD